MKSTRPGVSNHPILYRYFADAQEIADVINRSRWYVFKALKVGFTKREQNLLSRYAAVPVEVLFTEEQRANAR